MRKIKFRGIVEKERDKWNNAGKFAYGYLLQDFNGDYMIATLTDTSHGVIYQYVDRDTVGQFTGLHDKNGVEIFEGDIVKDEYGDVAAVIFTTEEVGSCGCCYDEFSGSGFVAEDNKFYRLKIAGNQYIEVIGNIHEGGNK